MNQNYTKQDAVQFASDEHSEHGNIYNPYHIEDEGNLRYRVVSVDTGDIAIEHATWSMAVHVARTRNAL